MTTTPLSDVPLPAGASAPQGWLNPSYEPQPYRIVYGAARVITDHGASARARAWQNSDGALDEIVVVVGTAEDETEQRPSAPAGLSVA
jgi:hypothetical protein